MIFGLIDGPRENLKIILSAIKDLSIPLDRAHRVALDTSIFRIDIVKKMNIGSFYWNMVPEFY